VATGGAPTTTRAESGDRRTRGPSDDAPTTANDEQPRIRLDIVAVIVALALVIGVASWRIVVHGQDRADQRAARSELTQIVESMSGLPRLYGAITSGDDAAKQANWSAYNSELNALVAQAERIVAEHGAIAAGADYLSIGVAHVRLAAYDRAIPALEQAEQLAVQQKDSLVGIASQRALAVAHFAAGDPAEGRDAFDRALAAEDFDLPEQVLRDHSVVTLSQWIQAEVSMSSCEAARSLLEYLRPIVPSPMTMDPQQYASLLQQDEAAVTSCT
jgi:tetratricopeptide (TPR) repeat protein